MRLSRLNLAGILIAIAGAAVFFVTGHSASADVPPGKHKIEALLAAGYEVKAGAFATGLILQKGPNLYSCFGDLNNGKMEVCDPVVSE